MSYTSIATMAGDMFLRDRITASAATQDVADPVGWMVGHVWNVVAAPGWADDWDSAVAGGVPDPGKDEAVISDGEILTRVQQVLAG